MEHWENGLVAGGDERPLDEKLPDNFEFEVKETILVSSCELTGAIELHRLVLDDPDQLKRRKEEITEAMINATCSIALDDGYIIEEVRQAPLPKFVVLGH